MDKKFKEYLESINQTYHTTIDPKGPGVVRLHLVPPEKIRFGIPWLVIINGQDILPLSLSWAILLKEFIEEVNSRNHPIISEEDMKTIIDNTVLKVKEIYPKTDKKMIENDLKDIIDTFVRIARGKKPRFDIGYLDLKHYAKNMSAPHRMDLMISPMMKNNHWHCNNKCLHCYASGEEFANFEEISTADWKTIIDKLRLAKVPQITFTGGEPTLRDDLVELIEYAKWHVTRLNTNGRLLTKGLCKDLYDASLDSVQITVYSEKKEIHNFLVGTDGLNDTLEGIKNAIDAHLNVSVNTPLCTLNKDYLSLIKFLHEEYNVRYFTCSSLIVSGNAAKDESKETTLLEYELFEIVKNAKKYCDENECELSFTTPGAIQDEKLSSLGMTIPMCGAASSNMGVAPNGDVIPCQSWLSKDNLGNLLTNDWKTIWNSKRAKAIRKATIRAKKCPLSNGDCR